ncbi:MAG: twin-arginine translocation signal domain-containing protein, partial [Caldilinea sp. CFX5]|nr:twin-arginine translocation signal domain-containing protein [Caldilinea sp. CFX5]
MKPATQDKQSQRVSRRTFLQALVTTTIGALSAACGPPRSTNQAEMAFGPQATPQVILPSPAPPTPAATTQEPPLLHSFLALSALLTGVANLNPALGQLYLQSLQASDEFAMSVTELFAQAGFDAATPPDSIAALEATGIFAQEPLRKLADKITELWYT